MILFFIITGFAFSESNLIKNPSFESVAKDGQPEYWRTHRWVNDDTVTTFSIDTELAYHGKKSAVIHNIKENHGFYYQTVQVEENTFYKVTGWIKTENVGNEKNGAGISLINYFEVGGDFKGTNDWQLAELYVSTGPGVSIIEIMCQIGNYGAENTGKAWFDDISVTKTDAVPRDAVITVVNAKNKKNQADTAKKKKSPPRTKHKGTFFLFIILITIVVLAGIVVIILIIIMGRNSKEFDEEYDDEAEDDQSGIDT